MAAATALAATATLLAAATALTAATTLAAAATLLTATATLAAFLTASLFTTLTTLIRFCHDTLLVDVLSVTCIQRVSPAK